jgi:hypothetical protein
LSLDIQVNYHTVADFRSLHGEFLDALLSDNLAALMAAGVVKLKAVAQDGMRVRASAGAGSFRREDKLKGYLEAARQRVEALQQQVDEDPGRETRRAQPARQRASRRNAKPGSKPLWRGYPNWPRSRSVKASSRKPHGPPPATRTQA